MKKQAFLRGLLGFPLGMTMGYIITMIISLISTDGNYTPCVPELIDQMGNEIKAVILQAVLSGLLGSAFAASSVIWEIDSWSITKQSGIYFLITALVMLPVAYFANWMEHTLAGFIAYFGIFCGIFIVVWVAQYLLWKNKIKGLNDRMKKQ